MMNVQIHYDDYGKVVAVSEVHPATPASPGAGLLPMPQFQSFSVELKGAAAKQPLIVLHTANVVDVRHDEPRLIAITRGKRKKN